MTLQDSLRISFKSLKGHKLRTFLTIFGICVGVGSVVILTALGEGARNYVQGEFESLGSNLLGILPGYTETQGGPINPLTSNTIRDLTLEDARALKARCSLIDSVVPIVLGNSPVRYGPLLRSSTVIGTNYNYKEIHNLKLRSGAFLDDSIESSGLVCVLGKNIYQSLFGAQNPLGEVLRIGDWRFRVIGVTVSPGNMFGVDLDDIVFIPVATSMRLFDRTGLFRIAIQCQTAHSVKEAREQIRQILIERHDGEEDFTVVEPSAMQESFTGILTTLSLFLVGIAAISLCVAGLGVMNLMLVTVSERRYEIGLFKALGAQTYQILRLFLTEAVILSLVGGLVGLLLGFGAIQALVWEFPSFPVSVPLWAVGGATLTSIAVGILFGLLPAWRASKIPAIEALS